MSEEAKNAYTAKYNQSWQEVTPHAQKLWLDAWHEAVSRYESSPMSEESLDILRSEIKKLKGHRTILRDSAKDVIYWSDKADSASSLYCIDRLRAAIVTTEHEA